MKKTEYLDLLRYYLDRFPKSMVDDIVRDYEEHFAIGLENGKTEDEISLELGAPFYVAQEYISGDFDRIHREDQRASAVREPEGFFAGDTDSDSEAGERYTTDPEHNPLYDFFARVQSEWNAGHKGKWILIGVLVLVALRMLPPLFSFVLALASLVLVVHLAIVAAPLAGGVASILGGMGMTNDDYLFFKNVFSNAGALDRIISFMNTTEDPAVERLLVPDMALTAAEYFAVEKNEKVLVLLTDMTSYADALSIVSNRMDQIPSKDSMPGSLYSDLAKIYEKAAQFPTGGSITIVAVTTLSGGDITHAVPDNTGYITEGQLFLRRDSDIGKVIVDPFRSLSRLKQLVQGKKTREDHPQVMNAAVRLYSDAANAKTKQENGFDLTDYDERTLAFAKDYSEYILAIDVNLDTDEMLDKTWQLLSDHFKPAEVNMKQELVEKYWQ